MTDESKSKPCVSDKDKRNLYALVDKVAKKIVAEELKRLSTTIAQESERGCSWTWKNFKSI